MVIPIWQRRCCSPQKESDFLKVTQQGSRELRLTRMSPDPQPRALPRAQCQLTENALGHRLHPLRPYENGMSVESCGGRAMGFRIRRPRFKSQLQLPGHQTSDNVVELSTSALHRKHGEENPALRATCFICSPSLSSSDKDPPSWGNCFSPQL